METINEKEFAEGEGFRTLLARQESQRIRYGLDFVDTQSMTLHKRKLEIAEVLCSGSEDRQDIWGRPVRMLVNPYDLAMTLFSMKLSLESGLWSLGEDDENRARNSLRDNHKTALNQVNTTIAQIAKGTYQFKKMEVSAENEYRLRTGELVPQF